MSSSFAVFNGHRRVPPPVNEPIRSYAPGSPERASLKARLDDDGRRERSTCRSSSAARRSAPATCAQSVMPHDHEHVLGDYHKATEQHVQQAIEAAAGRARRNGPAGRSTIAPPSSSRPPSC